MLYCYVCLIFFLLRKIMHHNSKRKLLKQNNLRLLHIQKSISNVQVQVVNVEPQM